MRPILLLAAFTVFFLLASGIAFAEENVAELKIEGIPLIVDAGTAIEFTFFAANRAGPACIGGVDYWLESSGQRLSQGSDTVYLGAGSTASGTGAILVPSTARGLADFYLEMKCNESTVLANKTIEVEAAIPAMPHFGTLDVEPGTEGSQVEFTYTINSTKASVIPVLVNETLSKDGQVVWEGTQNLPVAGESSFKRLGPVLSPGTYKLVVKASYGSESAQISREFTIKAVPFPFLQLLTIAALALFLVAGAILFAKFFIFGGKQFFRLPQFPSFPSPEQEPKQGLCVVESEASGVLDSSALNQLLDDAGFHEEEKAKAFEVAESVPLAQAVKSCVFTGLRKKMSFETLVKVTVSNSSSRDWADVIVVARIPDFLSGNIEDISSDVEMKVSELGPAIKFTLSKVGVMQSASIVYKVPKLISQEEADNVALPAIVSYRELRTGVIPSIKAKREKPEKQAEKAIEEKAHARKRPRKRHK